MRELAHLPIGRELAGSLQLTNRFEPRFSGCSQQKTLPFAVPAMRLRLLLVVGIWLLAAPARATPFDDTIQPVLKTHCVRCHGPNQPKAGLNLSTAAGLARGGESGPAVNASAWQQSLIWQRVADQEMPPDRPLPEAEQELLRKWLENGAAGLAAPSSEGSDHWAFQPLRRLPAPHVEQEHRARTDIDCFLLARLEPAGLTFAPDAARATLVRRVSLALTGLPPTLAELTQFEQDTAPGAYARLVDRYLASPRYGEHWGKHWLDAAGYADSNGYFSADTDRPLAYRYRDYVIRALNADKPFDQFVREQLAGDEMSGFRAGQPTTPEAIELMIATHFLRNGQDGTDIGVQEPEAFEIDRRAALEACVQVTASSLLGLTLHCARCHDHKFEPLTQLEYYQFQAIVFPAFNPQDWMNPKDRIAYAYLPGEKEAWQQQEQSLQRQLAELRDAYVAWLAEHREPGEVLFLASFENDDWQAGWSNTAPGDDQPGGQVSLSDSTPHAAQVVGGRLRILTGAGEAWLSTADKFDWTPNETGAWIEATFTLVDNKVGGGPAERIGYTIAAHDYDDSSSTEGGNLLIDGNPAEATSIYRDYPGTDSKIMGQIGEQGYAPGRSYGVRITNADEGKFTLEHLVDGVPDGKSLELQAADLPDGGFAFFYCCNRSYVVDDVRIERSTTNTSNQLAAEELAALRKQLAERRAEYARQRQAVEGQRTPEPGRAIAWVTDKSAQPPTVPFLTRGLYHERGPGVDPGVPRILSDSAATYLPRTGPFEFPSTHRRTALAEWLTQPEGRAAALLARVHVNRIWRQYFGRGIVATTDNLGQSGAAPTHPELLDHLAAIFIDEGWSQKAVHRAILLSTAFRQSSAPRDEGLAADPENRLLWRWPLRRLEAEVLRDSMLAVTGQLDLTPYGPYVPTSQSPVGEVVVDSSVPGARRRSVYLQQRRSQTLSLLRVFDAPALATVCSTRPSSTVPLQALALMNSDFAVTCREQLAERLLAEAEGEPADTIRHAWRLAIAREPTAEELAIALEFLATQQQLYSGEQSARLALTDFCQMLLASNAFLYVE